MGKKLQELLVREMRICEAVLVKAEELLAIRDNHLYQERDCSWEEYLRERHRMSKSTFKSLQASAKMYQRMATEFGVQLGNKSAARELRTLYARNSPVVERVVHQAQRIAGKGNPVTGAHIKAVVNTLDTVLATEGYCDDGDGGMIAFDAQIDAHYTEQLMRQKQHAIDGAKANGWSKPQQMLYTAGGALVLPDIQPGAIIEFRYRVVEPGRVI